MAGPRPRTSSSGIAAAGGAAGGPPTEYRLDVGLQGIRLPSSVRVGITEVSGSDFVSELDPVEGAINPALSSAGNGAYQPVYQRSANGNNNVFRRRGCGFKS